MVQGHRGLGRALHELDLQVVGGHGVGNVGVLIGDVGQAVLDGEGRRQLFPGHDGVAGRPHLVDHLAGARHREADVVHRRALRAAGRLALAHEHEHVGEPDDLVGAEGDQLAAQGVDPEPLVLVDAGHGQVVVPVHDRPVLGRRQLRLRRRGAAQHEQPGRRRQRDRLRHENPPLHQEPSRSPWQGPRCIRPATVRVRCFSITSARHASSSRLVGQGGSRGNAGPAAGFCQSLMRAQRMVACTSRPSASVEGGGMRLRCVSVSSKKRWASVPLWPGSSLPMRW